MQSKLYRVHPDRDDLPLPTEAVLSWQWAFTDGTPLQLPPGMRFRATCLFHHDDNSVIRSDRLHLDFVH
jgi:hypothetical protein